MAQLIKKLKKVEDTIEYINTLTIEELENIITYAADKYYNTQESVISDEIYDILIDFLKLKDSKSIVLKEVGAKVHNKNKVELDYWLGSMDKIKDLKHLSLWVNKYKQPYNLSDKLDGVSALLVYNNNEIKMSTRGTATEGTDISNLIKYLNLPDYKTIEKYCKINKIKGTKNLIAFRGELIMKEKTFIKNWGDKLKNTRNTISGLVNSKTINPELACDTELILYEIIDPFYPIDKQFEIIDDIGFKISSHNNITHDITIEFLSSYFKTRRETSDYKIDGIIVTQIGDFKRNSNSNPDYAFAFKEMLDEQMAITIVESIEWNLSKDGYLKPTLKLKPITIGGVEIKRVTGNNAKFIVDNLLGSGAKVEIVRSGDVIPKINKVIKPVKTPDLPEGKWSWNDTNVDIIIDDIKNDEIVVKNIYFFFSSLSTKGLGKKIVEKLVANDLNSIIKIITAKESDFVKIEGIQEKLASNLVESIKTALTNVKLSKLMAASNKLGRGIGEERIEQVLLQYPKLLIDYKEWSKKEFIDNLKEINGWEDKTAQLLVSHFDDFMIFYDSIKKYISIEIKTKIIKGKFLDKIFIFTGFRDDKLQELIKDKGGKIGTSVSKNTDYLVVKDQDVIDNPTGKINKALELEINIITKDDLIKMLK